MVPFLVQPHLYPTFLSPRSPGMRGRSLRSEGIWQEDEMPVSLLTCTSSSTHLAGSRCSQPGQELTTPVSPLVLVWSREMGSRISSTASYKSYRYGSGDSLRTFSSLKDAEIVDVKLLSVWDHGLRSEATEIPFSIFLTLVKVQARNNPNSRRQLVE